MIHDMSGPWAISDVNTFIPALEVYSWIERRKIKPKQIRVSDIGHKPTSNILLSSHRYIQADTSMPVILAEGMENPMSKPYRMIDGRHRMLKAINNGSFSILSYVVSEADILRFVKVGGGTT